MKNWIDVLMAKLRQKVALRMSAQIRALSKPWWKKNGEP
jgi:hypothetical protein